MSPQLLTVLDRHFAPLAVGDRVAFRDAYYYINLCDGTGTIDAIDQWGGLTIATDRDMRKADRYDALHLTRTWYFCTEYDRSREAHVAARTVGDRYEHGVREVWVEKRPAAEGAAS